ncbi:hypothetical protein CBR_g10859 [Chara braunii]|uniref:Mediator of RNA polymerase II transcription subunit 28 n=1 Tax=Chara braunii TaxID=69332 RepID=A0A388KPQ6_CHABU|nr:hypothetical protein CBR_g10859 [Chara braunii]|eukprot:GBG71923.1 hypothetical protein CBR_g10859 [Chara braunii]
MDVSYCLQLVDSLDAMFLAMLPLRELNPSLNRTPPSLYAASADGADVEGRIREFLDAACELEANFVNLRLQHQQDRKSVLKKEIATLEAEIREKDALVKKTQASINAWRQQVAAAQLTLEKSLKEV